MFQLTEIFAVPVKNFPIFSDIWTIEPIDENSERPNSTYLQGSLSMR